MQLIKELIKVLKPNSFLKLGDKVSYLDEVITTKTKDIEKHDLVLIDCKKDYDTFKPLYNLALKSVTNKGVIIVNGALPKFSAYQDISKCGKLWYYILTSGYKHVYYNDNELGLSFIKNKKEEVIKGANPDFTWFYFNVKPVIDKVLKSFVKPTVKKKADDQVL